MSYSETITKEDLKNVLNEVLPPHGAITCETVTLPFTPTANGFLFGIIRASSAGRVYISLSNASPGGIDGYQAASGYVNGLCFVTKGQQVTQTDSWNLSQIVLYFVGLD